MEKENYKKELLLDPLWNLETASANLTGDIQQLAYIQDELEAISSGRKTMDILFLINSIEILIKSMFYNQDNMKNSINAIYEKNRAEKKLEGLGGKI